MDATEVKSIIGQLVRTPGMVLPVGTFAGTCGFLAGLEAGTRQGVYRDFELWIGRRHGLRPELALPSLVMEVATGSANVYDLEEPGRAEAARQCLIELLQEFLADGETDEDGVIE